MEKTQTVTCPKCDGSGYVSTRVSRGCAGDICFQCMGAKTVTVKIVDEAAKARREAKKESARIAKLAQRDIEHKARMEAFAVENPELAMRLENLSGEVGNYTRYVVANGEKIGSGYGGDIVTYVESVLASHA